MIVSAHQVQAKALVETRTGLLETLDELVNKDIRGNPMSLPR
jgi:hypothetical protein